MKSLRSLSAFFANFYSPDPESHIPGIGQVVSDAVIFQKAFKRIISHEVYPLREYMESTTE